MIVFPSTFNEILERVQKIDLDQYSLTRDYTDGAVSYLSPYISRGVLTLPYLLKNVLEATSPATARKFIFELAWREYFQRVWVARGWEILTDINNAQKDASHHQHIQAIVSASTGIEAVDNQIKNLYDVGYVHNHARMYIASITCNIGRAHWEVPAKWMYYHLLDGDLASNSLSWQWVAGTFSSKKYYCNQSNINQYTGSTQTGTFIDTNYESLPLLPIPNNLVQTTTPDMHFRTHMNDDPRYDYALPLIIYNSYNLDPVWRSSQPANRILLLEPSHFKKFPISSKVLNFIIALSANISGIQIVTSELDEIPQLERFPVIYSKDHPAFQHYPDHRDPYEWMFPHAVLKSLFSAYWKSCQKLYPDETSA